MTTTPHLSREDWVAVARDALTKAGIDDVKVDRLAKKLRVTRGSFYWHFKHRKDLLDALLNDWQTRNYDEIDQIRARWDKHEPDLSEVVLIWLDEDWNAQAFSIAVRAWARKSAPVNEAVRRVDDSWIELLVGLFERTGYDKQESYARARAVCLHQIGYYCLGLKENREERARILPADYRIFTGREPSERLTAALAAVLETKPKRRRKAVESL